MSWLDPLLAIKTQQAGTTAGTRQTINFASGATVTDDPANDRVNVTIAGGLPGVTVTGTPTAGQTVVASSASAAAWGNVPIANVTNTGGATGDLVVGSGTALQRLGIGSAGQVLTVSGGTAAWSSGNTDYITYCEQTWALNAGTIANGATVTPTLVTGTSMSWTAYVSGSGTLSTDATGLKLVTTGASVGLVHLPITALARYAFSGRPWRLWVLWDTTAAGWTATGSYYYTGISTDVTNTRNVLLARYPGTPTIYTASGTISTPWLNNQPAGDTNASMAGSTADVHVVEQAFGVMGGLVGANSAGSLPAYSALRPYFGSTFAPNLLGVSSNGAGTQQTNSYGLCGFETGAISTTLRLLRTRLEIAL